MVMGPAGAWAPASALTPSTPTINRLTIAILEQPSRPIALSSRCEWRRCEGRRWRPEGQGGRAFVLGALDAGPRREHSEGDPGLWMSVRRRWLALIFGLVLVGGAVTLYRLPQI